MPETPLANITATLQRALPSAPRNWIVKRAPWLVSLGLLVLAAWLCARLVWQFMAPPPKSPAPVRASPTGTAQLHQRPPAEQIAAAHLFGQAAASGTGGGAAGGVGNGEKAPETTLDLKLLGVAAGKDGAKSQAIIASGTTHEEKTYSVGDSLPGNAVIRQVLPDRVIIAHNGRLEMLRLPIAGTSLLATSMSFGPAGAVNLGKGNNLNSLAAGRVRGELERHPETVTRYMRWRPYSKDGKQQGVEVNPGPNPNLFERAGLKPGDVITSVNGIKLDNRPNLIRGMSSLRGTAHLIVLRQGKQIPITVDFSALTSGG